MLHDAYLKNNEDNHKLKIQNEQLLEKLQDTCSSSYVSDCHMVDCLEDSHDMMHHEKLKNYRFLMCLKNILMRSNHLLWCKSNLSCLLKMVTHFLKKCMIPPHSNQSMRKILHF